MQNRYVGDVGDFGKYGLLRALCHPNSPDHFNCLHLGVVWYLTDDESHNDDGKHIGYLESTPRNLRLFRECDPDLYGTLQAIVHCGARHIRSIRRNRVLPADTQFYESPLTFVRPQQGRLKRVERLSYRTTWSRQALKATNECDIVFLDPDNGLETKTMPYQKTGPKYVYFDELRPYVARGQSLIIYHHIGRRRPAIDQIKERFAQIKAFLGKESFALLFHRGSARAYFIVPSEKHWGPLYGRSTKFIQGPWSRHFELVTPE